MLVVALIVSRRGGGAGDRRDRRIGSGRLTLGHGGVAAERGNERGGEYRNPPRDLGTRETLREKARMSQERDQERSFNRRDSDRNMSGGSSVSEAF